LNQRQHDARLGECFYQALHHQGDPEQSKVAWSQKAGHQRNLDDARSRGQGITEDQPKSASQDLLAQSAVVRE